MFVYANHPSCLDSHPRLGSFEISVLPYGAASPQLVYSKLSRSEFPVLRRVVRALASLLLPEQTKLVHPRELVVRVIDETSRRPVEGVVVEVVKVLIGITSERSFGDADLPPPSSLEDIADSEELADAEGETSDDNLERITSSPAETDLATPNKTTDTHASSKRVRWRRHSTDSGDVLRNPALESRFIRHSEALFRIRSWGRKDCLEWFRSCSFPEDVISNILAEGVDSGDKLLKSMSPQALTRWGLRNKKDINAALHFLETLASNPPDGLYSEPKLDRAQVLLSRPLHHGLQSPDHALMTTAFLGSTDSAGVVRCSVAEEGSFFIRLSPGAGSLSRTLRPLSSPLLSINHNSPLSTSFVMDASHKSGMVEVWLLGPKPDYRRFLFRTGILVCFRRLADGHRFLQFLPFRWDTREYGDRFSLRYFRRLPEGKYVSEVDGGVFSVTADGEQPCCELFYQNVGQLRRSHYRCTVNALRKFQRYFRRKPRRTLEKREADAMEVISRALRDSPFLGNIKERAALIAGERIQAIVKIVRFQAIIRGNLTRREAQSLFALEGSDLLSYIRTKLRKRSLAALAIQSRIRTRICRNLKSRLRKERARRTICRFLYSRANSRKLAAAELIRLGEERRMMLKEEAYARNLLRLEQELQQQRRKVDRERLEKQLQRMDVERQQEARRADAERMRVLLIQAKAAKVIQTRFRGWYGRLHYRICVQAAIVLQRSIRSCLHRWRLRREAERKDQLMRSISLARSTSSSTLLQKTAASRLRRALSREIPDSGTAGNDTGTPSAQFNSGNKRALNISTDRRVTGSDVRSPLSKSHSASSGKLSPNSASPGSLSSRRRSLESGLRPNSPAHSPYEPKNEISRVQISAVNEADASLFTMPVESISKAAIVDEEASIVGGSEGNREYDVRDGIDKCQPTRSPHDRPKFGDVNEEILSPSMELSADVQRVEYFPRSLFGQSLFPIKDAIENSISEVNPPATQPNIDGAGQDVGITLPGLSGNVFPSDKLSRAIHLIQSSYRNYRQRISSRIPVIATNTSSISVIPPRPARLGVDTFIESLTKASGKSVRAGRRVLRRAYHQLNSNALVQELKEIADARLSSPIASGIKKFSAVSSIKAQEFQRRKSAGVVNVGDAILEISGFHTPSFEETPLNWWLVLTPYVHDGDGSISAESETLSKTKDKLNSDMFQELETFVHLLELARYSHIQIDLYVSSTSTNRDASRSEKKSIRAYAGVLPLSRGLAFGPQGGAYYVILRMCEADVSPHLWAKELLPLIHLPLRATLIPVFCPPSELMRCLKSSSNLPLPCELVDGCYLQPSSVKWNTYGTQPLCVCHFRGEILVSCTRSRELLRYTCSGSYLGKIDLEGRVSGTIIVMIAGSRHVVCGSSSGTLLELYRTEGDTTKHWEVCILKELESKVAFIAGCASNYGGADTFFMFDRRLGLTVVVFEMGKCVRRRYLSTDGALGHVTGLSSFDNRLYLINEGGELIILDLRLLLSSLPGSVSTLSPFVRLSCKLTEGSLTSIAISAGASFLGMASDDMMTVDNKQHLRPIRQNSGSPFAEGMEGHLLLLGCDSSPQVIVARVFGSEVREIGT